MGSTIHAYAFFVKPKQFPLRQAIVVGIVGPANQVIRIGDVICVRDRLTWLPNEVEMRASGELFVCVLVLQIDGNSSSDSIVMHYKDKVKGVVPDLENRAKV